MRKRFKHNLSNFRDLTFNQGELVPCAAPLEVIPGDTIQHRSSSLVRVSPLVAPIMHPVYANIIHAYVPYRLIWDNWEDFITGGEDGADTSVMPTITFASGVPVGSLGDHFGLPTGVTNLTVNALAFRAYTKIYNDLIRNRDLQSELTIDTSDGADTTTNTALQNVLWEKDYFTSAQPQPQLGSAVTMPLGDTADVGFTTSSGFSEVSANDAAGLGLEVAGLKNAGSYSIAADDSMTADLSSAAGATIREWRESLMLQKEAEARQIFGASYHEYLRYYGISGHDARLQRAELLGRSSQILQFSEVLQTGVDSTDSGLGNLGGHGIGAMRSNRYRRFIPEHGLIISMMYIRPKTIYSEGLHKQWFRSAKEDFWSANLEAIGMEEVLNKELYADHTTPDGVFGYQHRYESYRSIPSSVSGDFRDGSNLDHWHMARFFSSDPALNSTFVECNPTNRIYASTTEDQIYAQVYHSIQARRMVRPRGVVPKITL